jgi:uncharacterized protein YihD (DUF1040 family)
MRDPERIEVMLNALREAWCASPDLRLGQLIVNAVRPSEPCPQVFYIEDDVMLDRLRALRPHDRPGSAR